MVFDIKILIEEQEASGCCKVKLPSSIIHHTKKRRSAGRVNCRLCDKVNTFNFFAQMRPGLLSLVTVPLSAMI